MPDQLPNPNAASDYMQTVDRRKTENQMRDFIQTADAQDEKTRAQMLTANGLDPDTYIVMKQHLGFTLSPEEQQRQQEVLQQQQQTQIGSLPAQTPGGIPPMVFRKGGPISPGAPQMEAPKTDFMSQLQQFGRETGLEPDTSETPEQARARGIQTATKAAMMAGGIGGEGVPTELPEAAIVPTEAAAAPAEIPPAAPSAPPPAGAEAPPPETPGGGIEHTEQAIYGAATANPMTAREMADIELDGEGAHALPKDHMDAVQLVRVRNYAAQKADEAIAAAREAKTTGDPDALQKAKDLIDEIKTTVKPRFDAANHYAGLQLHFAGDPASRKVLQDLADNTDIQDEAAWMRAVADIPTSAERIAMTQELADVPKWRWRDMLYNLYIRHRLSLNSIAKKSTSDMINIPFQLGARLLSEAASVATGGEIQAGEFVGSVRAMTDNLGSVLAYGVKSLGSMEQEFAKAKGFRGGVGFYDQGFPRSSLMAGSGWEDTAIGKAIDLYGHMLSIPPRGLTGIDQFSKGMQYNMTLGALAWREGYSQALDEGLTGLERANRARDLYQMYMQKPLKWMVDQAWEDAQTNTFTAPLEGRLAKMDTVRKTLPGGRLLVPFFRTRANLTVQGIRNGPLAVISPYAWRTVARGGAEGTLQAAKIALGSVMAGYYMTRIIDGSITGAAPDYLPRNLLDLWKTNHQPYSLKGADGQWHSYEGREPLSFQLGMLTRLARVGPYLENSEYDHVAGELIRGFTLELFSRDPMWGLIHTAGQLMDSAIKGDLEGSGFGSPSQVAGKEMEVLVPQDVANIATGLDPVRRKLLTMMSHLENRIPYVRKNGLTELNPYGDVEHVPLGYAFNEFPSWRTTPAGEDPVTDEMVRLHYATGFNIPSIPKGVGPGRSGDPGELGQPTDPGVFNTALTDEEQHRWMELRGHPPDRASIYDRLQAAMDDPRYQVKDDLDKAKRLTAIWAEYQGRAFHALRQETDIKDRMRATLQQKQLERITARASALGTP